MATKTRAQIRVEGAEMLLASLGIKAEDLAGLVQKAQGAVAKPAPQPRQIKVEHNTDPESREYGVVTIYKMGKKNGKDTWYPRVGISRRDLAAVIKELTAAYRAEKATEEAAKA